MNNKIKTILMAAIMSSVVLTQGVCVSAAQFDDGASAFSDGTGSVSALASTLAKQTEEQTQEFVAKEEEAAQIREERRVEKAEKASEKAEQEKTAALESIQQTVEDTKEKIAEEAEAKRLAKRQEVVNFALQFEGNPYVYGGTSLTNGADCSGFVMSVFVQFGLQSSYAWLQRSVMPPQRKISASLSREIWYSTETDILIMWHFISEMERLSMPAMLLQESRFPITIMSSRQLWVRSWNSCNA